MGALAEQLRCVPTQRRTVVALGGRGSWRDSPAGSARHPRRASQSWSQLAFWCPGPDLNRHDGVTRRGILSPLCIPVSPPGPVSIVNVTLTHSQASEGPLLPSLSPAFGRLNASSK